MALVACPFCREMFEEGEANQCPVCGVGLQKFEKLPPRPENLAEDGAPHEPEYDNLPFTFWGRSRGALVALAAVGLALFFLEWASRTQLGDKASLSGIDVAQQLRFPWIGAVAWFVMIPMALSRRSIMSMRGARVAAGFLGALPGIIAVALLAQKPDETVMVQVRFMWPIWGTLIASILAVGFAIFFGGRVDDIKVKRGTSAGQTVH